MATTRTVTLTPAESLFRRFLLDCRQQKASDLELRFTGGWVRDKLLEVPSHDIDVGLSTMTGMQFAEILQDFVKDGLATLYEDEARNLDLKSPLGSIHQIAANPEKSKHLETVTTNMFGFEVDLVNLRKEVYAEDSRNPQMEFGTPQEDALRRDATINALFYNLQTQQVEDFTGYGLQDMTDKIIRTPLLPYQTFKDDPLRVLRLIRFASRLNYEIEASAREAMKDPSIHSSLRAKISRERVGKEVEKMLSENDPLRALTIIYELDLHLTVFADPTATDTDAVAPDITPLPAVYKGLQSLLLSNQPTYSILNTELLLQDPTLSWYLAAYTSWSTSESATIAAAREGIKAPRKLQLTLGNSVRYRPAILEQISLIQKGDCSRSSLGMFVRRQGKGWRSHILYSMLVNFGSEPQEAVCERYSRLLELLRKKNLLAAAELAPILNGNKIKKAVDAKSGPWVTNATAMVVEWQLDNPDGTESDATEMLKGRKGELGLG